MTTPFDGYPARTRSILARIAEGADAEILSDDRAGDRFLIDTLVRSADPVLTEIGRQLRDGQLTYRELTESATYRDLLDRGLESLDRLSPDTLEAALNNTDTHRPPPRDVTGSGR